jgi:hypothetical protein
MTHDYIGSLCILVAPKTVHKLLYLHYLYKHIPIEKRKVSMMHYHVFCFDGIQ